MEKKEEGRKRRKAEEEISRMMREHEDSQPTTHPELHHFLVNTYCFTRLGHMCANATIVMLFYHIFWHMFLFLGNLFKQI